MDRLDVSEESNPTRDRAQCSVSKIAGNTPVAESSVTDCYRIAHKPGAFQLEEGWVYCRDWACAGWLWGRLKETSVDSGLGDAGSRCN